jgi:endoglucanase
MKSKTKTNTKQMPSDATKTLLELTSLPTAPFLEGSVLAYVRNWVSKRPYLKVQADRFGNLLIVRRGKATKRPRLVMVAHGDHPGYVAKRMTSPSTLEADFRGGVMGKFAPTARVRFFTPEGPVIGKVLAHHEDESGRLMGALFRVPREVAPESLGMFDVGEARLKSGRLVSRVCDDLAGVAAALVAMEKIESADVAARKKSASTKAAHDRAKKTEAVGDVALLLTRGEEMGFVGAIAAVRDGKLLRASDRIISIECSAEQPVARQGEGVVLRVGDRTSVFHSAFGRFLRVTAEDEAKRDRTFKFQRALMPGGTCEGTVFDAYGYITAAVCVPLGCYHNMDQTTGKIAAEHVHLGDWWSMTRLLALIGLKLGAFDGSHAELKAFLDERFGKLIPMLRPIE